MTVSVFLTGLKKVFLNLKILLCFICINRPFAVTAGHRSHPIYASFTVSTCYLLHVYDRDFVINENNCKYIFLERKICPDVSRLNFYKIGFGVQRYTSELYKIQ